MIICNSHNFAVTRAQKTGGSSIEIYILQSGLVDESTDEYALEGGFSSWQEYKNFSDNNHNLHYKDIPKELWGEDSLRKAQITFAELVEQGKIAENMPCIGGIRHPFEWLASLFYYANVRREIHNAQVLAEGKELGTYEKLMNEYYPEPDSSWDFVFRKYLSMAEIQRSLKPQTDYYPDHAQLFNIENIHEHVSKFIADKGGIVPTERVQVRKSNNDPTYYINNLSDDRKKMTLEIYEKDLIAWEKAYAVYN